MIGRKLHTASLLVEPAQYLAGWRPDAGALFLPALSTRRVGDEVAVRVGVAGQSIAATVFGVVSLVRRVGRPSLPPGIELKLDRVSVPAAIFLATAARGEPVTFRERAPRYVVARVLRISHVRREREVLTRNVSQGGCAVEWLGAPPPAGEVLAVRFGRGLFGSTARAVVCWRSADERPAIGLRVVADGRAARSWQRIVSSAARAGNEAV